MLLPKLLPFTLLPTLITASWYDEAEVDWNLNANQNASSPLNYTPPAWPSNHSYNPSPHNWRFPFYSFFLDRFVNGDPSNDNVNGTSWEHDVYGTQLRHGGDIKGLQDSLDYLHGMGIRGLYIAGSNLINLPWAADQYSPLDHTILDHHLGTIQQYRDAIEAIHAKGMYVIFDNTMATMSDLFAFQGYANTSAAWSFKEHDMFYKSETTYRDYSHSNDFQEECAIPYPRFWDQGGHQVIDNNTKEMTGCMDSEFDQYGDVGAFGTYPEWQKQLSKFGGVQDRLRDWRPSVLDKINHFSCMMIQGLDIDGWRMDKAMQITVDSLGNFSSYQRQCAATVGKTNFFIAGEMVNGNADASIYLGRGKEPSMMVNNLTKAVTSNGTKYIRDVSHSALDAAAFHYSTYRALMRFLGLDGDLLAANDAPVNFQDQWHTFLASNDMNNAYTGQFDPRHMYGVSNQDVIRWPGLTNGTERQLLGDFVVTLLMPGIPLVSWGEEQAFYTLDSTASNYVYGRQAMSSAQAWQMHGCYKVGDTNLNNAPLNSSLVACEDDGVSLDHRDPSHPVYGFLKQMYEMRQRYPVLNDGWGLTQLSNQTFQYTLPGSFGVPTETGLWSVFRARFEGVQDFTGQGTFGNQGVWLLYSNYNDSNTYTSDCTSVDAIIAPFDPNTTVKNLFYPFDEWTLSTSVVQIGLEGAETANGCMDQVNMTRYGFKAFVPKSQWLAPSPVITKFLPAHDARILSNTSADQPSSVSLEVRFSTNMDCDSFKNSFSVNSTTESGKQAHYSSSNVNCGTIDPQFEAYFYGPSPSIWRAQVTLDNVYDGVHIVNINNVTNSDHNMSTNSNDHFMFRIGQSDNPIVFPKSANYSNSLLFNGSPSKWDIKAADGLYINHKAAGADMWRFSMSFGAVWSDWMPYVSGNASLPPQSWNGNEAQSWTGDHVQVQYWSAAAGSSDHVTEGDLFSSAGPARRFPHLHIHGSYNKYGFDSGLPNEMQQLGNGTWAFDFMDEWPSQFQVNVWGMASNGQPDISFAFGDVDNDTVLERIAPTSLQMVVTNITNLGPQSPFLSWQILFDDGTLRYWLVPTGSRYLQLALWLLLLIVPVCTATGGVYLYTRAYYGVKFNQIGLSEKRSVLPVAMKKRRTVLIATMEYDIADWSIKVKIGGLGVMAQLMGKNLEHQDLVWVVPCAGGLEYPLDQPGLPIDVTILGRTYEVQVQYHKLNNITYMLLDAPVFRRQTSKEPYPARMDDLDSAIYYSAWNQCIAEAMRRFPVDIYHINDYHGTIAPLYLLPDTVPCCLSLHNAEFQGLWPMRNPREVAEICSVFNLPQPVVQRYVQFGEVFNLLHAGASILRIHQKGFGAVGVSKKYGKRSWARYPIFWGLKKIGALPNPDPSDVAEWDKKLASPDEIHIDQVFESARAGLKRQAQEWAGLEQRADADLFVFVGRWSMQKGIDLIADVFPAVLEQYPHTQLICVGPTIDLYGKFAALKLDKMMQKYPGRVYSKPEFTALPPFIFSGAEFALIPSRDEPFGLVAVEFGRKGALGVGSRVGGLGQMPGWWYTIESTTTKHQMHQFKMAIAGALKSNYDTRAMMRARSAKQRFPVAQWKEDLEILQTTSINIHKQQMDRISAKKMGLDDKSVVSSGWNTPNLGSLTPRSGWATPNSSTTPTNSRPGTRSGSPDRSGATTPTGNAGLSLGLRHGPGHSPPEEPLTRARSSEMRRISYDEEEERRRRGRQPESVHEEHISSERAEHAKRITTSFAFLSHPHTPLREDPPRPMTPLSTEQVMDEKKGQPQELTPFFTDPTGLYYKTFEKKLESLNGKNSESQLCIEEYLEKSEKQWFNRLHIAKMSRNTAHGAEQSPTPAGSIYEGIDSEEPMSQFLLPQNYQAPTGLKRLLMYKVGDWPVYTLLLALGQVLAANSYQITLLSGQVGQTAQELYIIASVYAAHTIIWWVMYRRLAARYVLALPFLFYGMAFWLLGFAPFGSTVVRGWVQFIATIMYATASSAGSFYFSQNFGTTGAAPVKDWAFRACAIQGTQQLYTVGLWAWGAKLTRHTDAGGNGDLGFALTGIGIPVALLLWAIGLVLFFGLPQFYLQKPGAVPDFYKSVMRRKVIIWFWIAVILQNIFLSGPYGRNWSYLFASKHAPGWAVFLLVLFFFVVVWAAVLWYFSILSQTHSWFVPLFAVGLLAPRWAQIWWGVSNIGTYLPWAGSPLASALLGRGLWLWLGLLDTIQSVGIGMLLLQTMVRAHVTWALVCAQVLGSIATIIARADGLNSVGPGPTFPSIASNLSGLGNGWFWICLACQLAIPVGFFTVFRKEQLSKP
ncbi:glycosyltransferase family 5 protein [Baudoinia panamericana UAMH 10762]|uniref:alpha-1,3-glucan synthase n=1 Tax=Baudoinia panamericana (strain UAMH 10762) TaxID=717646 RepID=M2N2P9_BAUPA|nr:glycosyltransferase family 5 protein [Baudoinia panamericana UAMH 10762]EMC98218.1 glycosyltransferase family 5 protein [Baudoinia panamericana UAMH 10762]